MMNHAKKMVRQLDGKTRLIQGDPDAEKFYLAARVVQIGSSASGSVSSRSLPLFQIESSQGGDT